MKLTEELFDNPTEEFETYLDRNFVYKMFDIYCEHSDTPEEFLDGRILDVPRWCLEGFITSELIDVNIT